MDQFESAHWRHRIVDDALNSSNDVNKLSNISHIVSASVRFFFCCCCYWFEWQSGEREERWTCGKSNIDKSRTDKSTCYIFIYYNDLWGLPIKSNTITTSMSSPFNSLALFGMPPAFSIQIQHRPHGLQPFMSMREVWDRFLCIFVSVGYTIFFFCCCRFWCCCFCRCCSFIFNVHSMWER